MSLNNGAGARSGSDTTGPGMRTLGRSQGSPQSVHSPPPGARPHWATACLRAATYQETTGLGSPSTRMLMVTSWPSLTDWSIRET